MAATSTQLLTQALDVALPDAVIEEALRSILRSSADAEGHVPIEIDGRVVLVPTGATIEIVAKVFVREFHQIAFSTGYRAQVAIGGVEGHRAGAPKAVYCFATIFFNSDVRMIATDFHSGPVWI